MRIYIVYDGRAVDGDTDNAAALDCLGRHNHPPWREAKELWSGQRVVMYSYRVDGIQALRDERCEGVIR